MRRKLNLFKIMMTKSEDVCLKLKIRWSKVILVSILHLLGIWALFFLGNVKLGTVGFSVFYFFFGGLGVTAGAHRLLSHRSYKATLLLRIYYALGFSAAGQLSIFIWIRDHRMHHKFGDTDADPYNAKRGFFYSHVGWILTHRLPEYNRKVPTIDMSDIERDLIMMTQHNNYRLANSLMGIAVPTLLPMLLFNETFQIAFLMNLLSIAVQSNRLCISHHLTWCLNSVAHLYGYKPYDKNQSAFDGLALFLLVGGEGTHNYHHTFPQDYMSCHWSQKYFSVTTMFIEILNFLGLAYDLKTTPKDIVLKRMERTGTID